MSRPSGISAAVTAPHDVVLAMQMRDYAAIGMKLIWQRIIIFVAALVLAGFYYSVELALAAGAMIVVSEIYDYFVMRQIMNRPDNEAGGLRLLMIKLVICTVSGASVIVFYSVSIALIQGPGAHFMSLFFLFAAAIFAAMNNHQILPILVLRLVIYGSAFLLIPAYDIYLTGAAIKSELWAQLFTSVFVLYFVIDCSRVHLTLYRANMNQMAELRVQHMRAADALRIKSEFLSTMSHELRTPLTSIRGSIDLIGTGHFGEITPKVKSIVAIAQRNCSLLIHLVDDILDLQKFESGRMAYKMEMLNVTELVHQSIASNSPYADRLGIKLALESDDDSMCVTGDRRRLQQVLSNVLSNAAKFSPQGSTVSVKIERVAQQARISVSDMGVGLSESDSEKVFDRFSQLDASDTRKIGGTGLGMNISRRIMEAHGGVIRYAKNAGPGTTFYLEI